MHFWKKIKHNQTLRKRLEMRGKILNEIRAFFLREKFLEVDTPLLVPLPGLEPHLNPLEATLLTNQQKNTPAYLITSPEYSLKKLLVAGFERIFQLNKCWRGGEPYGGTHNPEFTMVEWYRTCADYHALMDDCERLVRTVHRALNTVQTKGADAPLIYQNNTISLTGPWKKISVKEAWQIYANLNLDDLLTKERMADAVRCCGLTVSPDDEFDDLFFKIFLTFIEPTIPKNIPLFLYEYPIQLAALSRACPHDPRYAERFELYIGGLELANAYSELTDAQEQKRRFEEDQMRRRQLEKNVYTIDTDFLDALASGLPPCAGISLGADRLVMLMADAASIDDVIYFPASDLFT